MSPLRLVRSGFVLLCANLIGFTINAKADVVRPLDCLPPISSAYVSTLAGFHQGWPIGAGTIQFSDPSHSQFSTCTAPPTASSPHSTDVFTSQLSGILTQLNGTSTFITANANVTVDVTFQSSVGNVRTFATQITQFDVSGGDLPAGVLLRQSLTEPTLGGTTITTLSNGEFDIHSFFDVFTDLSIDGGTTWIPSIIPGHVEVVDVPEPGTIFLMGPGVILALVWQRRSKRKASSQVSAGQKYMPSGELPV